MHKIIQTKKQPLETGKNLYDKIQNLGIVKSNYKYVKFDTAEKAKEEVIERLKSESIMILQRI